MIDQYLKELDEIIIAAEEIVDFKIISRTIWDTDLEKIGLYRYRVYFRDGSLLELTERLVEENEKLQVTKYRFHWQDKEGELIKRWDNAGHHPEIRTFPHHLHDGNELKPIFYITRLTDVKLCLAPNRPIDGSVANSGFGPDLVIDVPGDMVTGHLPQGFLVDQF